jgi:hypothetical protein
MMVMRGRARAARATERRPIRRPSYTRASIGSKENVAWPAGCCWLNTDHSITDDGRPRPDGPAGRGAESFEACETLDHCHASIYKE